MDAMTVSYEEFPENISYVEAELRLCDLYRYHKVSHNRQGIHDFLFAQLEKANKSIKMLIYLFLKRIRRDVVCVNLDIVLMLHSVDRCVRRLALRLVKLFWGFYESDEVIVHTVRRHPMFYGLFKKNMKYRLVYAQKIARHDARRGAPQSKIRGQKKPGGLGAARALRRSLRDVSTLAGLKSTLEKQLGGCTREEERVFQFFMGKISHHGKTDADWIPGIQLRKEEAVLMNGVDLGFELELMGLKTAGIYQAVSRAFERATGE